MATILQNLQAIKEEKARIKSVITSMGFDTASLAFKDYANKLSAISDERQHIKQALDTIGLTAVLSDAVDKVIQDKNEADAKFNSYQLSAEGVIDELNTSIEQTNVQLNNLQQKVDSQTAIIDMLSGDDDVDKAQIAELIVLSADLSGRVDEVMFNYSKLENDYNDLSGDFAALEAEHAQCMSKDEVDSINSLLEEILA